MPGRQNKPEHGRSVRTRARLRWTQQRHASPITAGQVGRFGPTGKSVNCCLPPFAKIFLFRLYPNHFYIHRRLAPLQGRIAIVTDAGRDAVDAAASGV